MKWFKHKTDASEDIKIKRLESEFKNDGYAVFFKLLEKIGKEGRKYRLKLEKYPIGLLSRDLNVSEEVLIKILNRMGEIMLISSFWLKKNVIYIPNMGRYADEYTEYLGRRTRETREKLGVDKNRIDKIRKEESVSSFKKKPYYKGSEMRKYQEKWWVLPKDGSAWLEFVGKESEIEWI